MMMNNDSNKDMDKLILQSIACIKFQSLWRGYSFRRNQSLIYLQNSSAKIIQKAFRSHLNRQHIHQVRVILAYFRIRRVFQAALRRMRAKKAILKLQEYDNLLNFYPSSSNPSPTKRPETIIRHKGKKPPPHSSTLVLNSKTKVVSKSTRSVSKPLTPRRVSKPIQPTPSPQPRSSTPKIKIRSVPSRKRKILIELPPPWHNKDIRRISQSQQEELMYTQKEDFSWAKKELFSNLWRKCTNKMNERDELIKKNKQFMERIVTKSFIESLARPMKALTMRNPRDICCIGDSGLIVVVSNTMAVILETGGFSDTHVIKSKAFSIPLYDIVVHKQSGTIIGLDTKWSIHLLHDGNSSISREFKVNIKFPKVQKYLIRDNFGMIWLNLIPQKGNLYLIDPLTLCPSIQINFDSIASIHRNIRNLVSLIPLSRNKQPYGFAATFLETNEVQLISTDFSSARTLKTPKIKGVPVIREVNDRLIIWGDDHTISIFELGDLLISTNCTGNITFSDTPVDICGISEPDLLFVSLRDKTVRVILGKGIELPLRVGKSKLTANEMGFIDKLLGPPKFTKSRSAYTEMCACSFMAVPVHIDVLQYTRQLFLLEAIFDTGTCCSYWLVNNPQQIQCKKYDSFEYSDSLGSQKYATEQFNLVCVEFQKSRLRQIDALNFLASFEETSKKGIISEAFNPPIEQSALLQMQLFKHPNSMANGSEESISKNQKPIVPQISNNSSKALLQTLNTQSSHSSFASRPVKSSRRATTSLNVITNNKNNIDIKESPETKENKKLERKENINMKEIKNKNNDNFSLLQLMQQKEIRCYFPFIQEIPPNELSAYELYHYLIRSGSLPEQLSSFSNFLQRFVPENSPLKKVPLPPEALYNYLLPVITSSTYKAIVTIHFSIDQIKDILSELDPLAKLKKYLGSTTLSSCNDQTNSSIQIKWLNEYERLTLSKIISKISNLEDLVKHEQMNRIQKVLENDLKNNLIQLPKSQKATQNSIDLNIHPRDNDLNDVKISNRPNRNHLLDDKRHLSIYESWADETLYGREPKSQTDLRVLYISSDLFGHSSVMEHFKMVRKLGLALKKVSSTVHSIEEIDNNTTQLTITEDTKALPLSHYLTIHSFLGGSARLVMVARSILTKVLQILSQLHEQHFILRTLNSDNIFLNSTSNQITIGSVYDSQLLRYQIKSSRKDDNSKQITQSGKLESSMTRSIYLPLPKHFTHFSNPFLPPEYFHEPPRHYTTAFDVWQFGMLLLYILTGFLPTSYGSELMKHIAENENQDPDSLKKQRRVVMEVSSQLDDPHLYPRCSFFYDWLRGATVVPTGQRCTGEKGECYITTDHPGFPPSILELDHYRLLPYNSSSSLISQNQENDMLDPVFTEKSPNSKYDESRIYLELIASCLQIDPSKRPSIADIKRARPFIQNTQIGEILNQYMRKPDPNIFVSQFFSPALSNLNDGSIDFSISIISALIFSNEKLEEDYQYSFPLDSRSSDQVTKALFNMKFIDRLVKFVLDHVASKIKLTDVSPNLIFENKTFDLLHHFFQRFVLAVDKGQGTLLNNVDEVIMSLLALYTGNPFLRLSSKQILASPNEAFSLTSYDSAFLCVFLHSKLHKLIQYCIGGLTFISSSLKRSTEHNDSYFEQFLSFGELVNNLSKSMCLTIEKQRSNAMKALSNFFQTGSSTSVVRLFIDYRVPQKLIQFFFTSGCCVDACSLICTALRAIRAKSYDPTYILMRLALSAPTVLEQCSLAFRAISSNANVNGSSNINSNSNCTTTGVPEQLKTPSLEIVRSVIFGESASSIAALVSNDILFTLADLANETLYSSFLSEVMSFSSIFVQQIISSSSQLQRTLRSAGIEWIPHVQLYLLNSNENINIKQALTVAKQLTSALFIRQSALPLEYSDQKIPIEEGSDFLIKTIILAQKEANEISLNLDGTMKKTTSLDLKGTSFLKTKSALKETSFSETCSIIVELCDVLKHLFRCLCYYWQSPPSSNCFSYPPNLFKFLLDAVQQPTPECKSISHPGVIVRHAIEDMLIYCLTGLQIDSAPRESLDNLPEVWAHVLHSDIIFLMHCVDKDVVEIQLLSRYPEEKQLRLKMWNALISDKRMMNLGPVFRVVIEEMLHNRVEFKLDSSFEMLTKMAYPLRLEAAQMVTVLLGQREKNQLQAKKLADELVAHNFLEHERKMTENDDNPILVNSSIVLLKNITHCVTLFDDSYLKQVNALLESLCMRFSREWMNIQSLSKPSKKVEHYNKKTATERASTSIAHSSLQIPSMKESWQRPMTSLHKKSDVSSLKSLRPKSSMAGFQSTPRRNFND